MKVDAALRRGGSPAQPDRRSEIGSHTPPKTRIFIRGGELEKVMRHFYENASFGSHDKLLLVCRRLLIASEKPPMNSKYEFIVATPAIFIRGGELE
ncbi:MAG TPA: hypothetical protein VMW38_05950 [Terriglobia bacterium]|nr:hypothetical protein [Terriglobia bacterium]